MRLPDEESWAAINTCQSRHHQVPLSFSSQDSMDFSPLLIPFPLVYSPPKATVEKEVSISDAAGLWRFLRSLVNAVEIVALMSRFVLYSFFFSSFLFFQAAIRSDRPVIPAGAILRAKKQRRGEGSRDCTVTLVLMWILHSFFFKSTLKCSFSLVTSELDNFI